MSSAIAVLRVRGRVHLRPQTVDTLRIMGLTRKNYCTILLKNDNSDGMIFAAKDYITWGVVDEKFIAMILKARGKISGDNKVTDSYIKEHSKHASIDALASAIAKGQAKLKDVEGLKRVFRLNPPRKGFERKGIKKPFKQGGALGNRGDKINLLLERML
jgi:large subunit ribosomal protein L30